MEICRDICGLNGIYGGMDLRIKWDLGGFEWISMDLDRFR